MTCPLYKDYTRECIEKFKGLIHLSNFEICESKEKYKKCPFYLFICKPEKGCKYKAKCIKKSMEKQSENSLNYNFILKIVKEYCYSDKRKKCARYKLKEKGKEIPFNLLPDGKKIDIRK